MNPVSPDALARSRFIDADRLALPLDRKWLGVAV